MSDSAFSPGRESMLRNHSIFSVRNNAGATEAENPARALHRSVSLANTESPVCSNEIKEAEQEVKEIIKEANLVHPDRLDSEVSWFFHRLGIDPFYFRSMPLITVAEHITALYAAKLLNVTTSEKSLSLRLHQEKETGAMYVVPSMNRNINDPTPNPSERIEYRIEREYLREGYDLPTTNYPGPGDFRVQVYRSSGTISESSTTKLRLFFVQQADFPNGDTKIDPSAPFKLEDVSDKTFYATISDSSKRIVTEMLEKAQKQQGPVIQVFDPEWSTLYGDTTREEVRLIVAYRQNSTHSFFSGLTALYHSHGLRSTRKYIEPFANGYYTYSLYLFRDLSVTRHAPSVPLKQIAQYVAEDASLIYVLPRTSLFELFTGEVLTASEVSYAYALWKFAHQFFSAMADEDFANLTSQVSSQATRGLLSKVRAGLRREVMTEGRVKDVVLQHASIIKLLYADFHAKFQPVSADGDDQPVEYHDQSEDILAKAKRAANTDLEIKILSCMCQFNRHVLKTNFFKTGKVALSFRLDPQFLARSSEYPTVPYAVFFVVGAEFRGFHIRFVDIARGGIRVIRSANEAAFAMNVSTLFEENYNLAHTQQRKNKDIPEGGSKGTILLSKEHQDKSLLAFKKYVDALLDLLLADSQVRDYHNQEELLFLGPDEGTADYMDWASLHAKERGYKFWKAFTTGKARALGGIPHDYYGMTTRSIHQFVLGILRKNNLEESTLRKFQTGGPDGDLGSNEIKISKDRTIGIVDGSGVLYDPQGIDRTELVRLAGSRLTSDHFDQSKLSKDGFFVNIQDNDKVLPNGTCIDSGLIFRNTFHLLGEYLFGTDLFVPCGGRPAAVNINNVHLLFDSATNAPMFKYIVEGANLFFTQDARLQLEKWGVTLFKDASANKGGVTSSSLEVLAALAFTDEEFEQHMQVRDPENVPAFYQQYVEEVQRIIEKHARDEFECLWREHELRNGKVPFCVLSDQLSEKINQLNLAIFSSSLWDNESLREKVISSALPRNLIELLGKDTVLTRVPDSYLHAIFSANLACQFVYTRGLDAGEFGFFEFMQSF